MSNVLQFEMEDDLAQAAAVDFFKRAQEAIEEKDLFTVVLSGGSTPKLLYKYLVYEVEENPPYQDLFEQIHFFWGDERDVPPDDKESNFLAATKGFLKPLHVPEQNIHRIPIEQGTLSKVAQSYAQEIKQFFKCDEDVVPQFDLVYLGMGEDGHTASLFPDSEALHEKEKWVVSNWIEKLNTFRVTFTLPLLNQAKQIHFLVSGKSKKQMLDQVLNSTKPNLDFPSTMIAPFSGHLSWWIDQSAKNGV